MAHDNKAVLEEPLDIADELRDLVCGTCEEIELAHPDFRRVHAEVAENYEATYRHMILHRFGYRI